MPIFQYKCESCSSVFEHLVSSIVKAKDVACVACDSKKITRLLSSGFGIKSKGCGGGECGGNCEGGCSSGCGKSDDFCPKRRGFAHSLN
jgi:putative FmdB family regulatory protein